MVENTQVVVECSLVEAHVARDKALARATSLESERNKSTISTVADTEVRLDQALSKNEALFIELAELNERLAGVKRMLQPWNTIRLLLIRHY